MLDRALRVTGAEQGGGEIEAGLMVVGFFLDAAAQILAKAGKPMRARELIAAMAEQNLWKSPGGKTPYSTLYAAMMREARDKGNASRFRKVDRGMFAVNNAGA